jgi:hypothetical protein
MSAYHDEEKDEDYLAVVRAVANIRGVPFENEMQRQRNQKADLERYEAVEVAKKEAEAEKRKTWVSICHQDVGDEILKHINGKTMHGYYKVTRTAHCYEFMSMDTNLNHPDWWKAIANKHVERFPLDMAMGVKDTAFKNVTHDKIYQG